MISGVPEGEFDLVVSKAGYERQIVKGIAVTSGDTATIDPVVLMTSTGVQGSITLAACTKGVERGRFLATDFTPGESAELIFGDVEQRSHYSFCLKASDDAGNISEADRALDVATGDQIPPAFAGELVADFNWTKREFELSWPDALASDLQHYQLTLQIEGEGETSSFAWTTTQTKLKFKSGDEVDGKTLTWQEGQTLTWQVTACDDAGVLKIAEQDNCASLAQAVVALDDLTPPQGFLGILDVQDHTTDAGVVSVEWQAPGNWEGYASFNIYQHPSDGEKVKLANCPCDQLDCQTTPRTHCPISGLPPGQVRLSVSALDAKGNEAVLNYSIEHQVPDRSPPEFSGALKLRSEYKDNIKSYYISYGRAIDNDDPEAYVYYKFFRKLGSPEDTEFTDLARPWLDPAAENVGQKVHGTRFDDPVSVAEGQVYIYRGCAYDSAGNHNCSTAPSLLHKVDDASPPKVLHVELLRPNNTGKWKIKVAASDPGHSTDEALENLTYTVHAFASEKELTEPFTPTEETKESVSKTGAQLGCSGYCVIGDFEGLKGLNRYMNYRVEVKDKAGNRAYSDMVTTLSLNQITLTSADPAFFGNKVKRLLTVKGTGFTSDMVAYIGDQKCVKTTYVAPDEILCHTPEVAADWHSMSVRRDGEEVGQSEFYVEARSCDGSTDCHHCDYPQHNGDMASGDGSNAKPFKVCHFGQLYYEFSGHGRRGDKPAVIELASHIDLTDWSDADKADEYPKRHFLSLSDVKNFRGLSVEGQPKHWLYGSAPTYRMFDNIYGKISRLGWRGSQAKNLAAGNQTGMLGSICHPESEIHSFHLRDSHLESVTKDTGLVCGHSQGQLQHITLKDSSVTCVDDCSGIAGRFYGSSNRNVGVLTFEDLSVSCSGSNCGGAFGSVTLSHHHFSRAGLSGQVKLRSRVLC